MLRPLTFHTYVYLRAYVRMHAITMFISQA